MRLVKTTERTPASAERQLAELIAKFDPNNLKLTRSVRRVLRKRLPTANELVYDYRKNFVIGYSPTERGSDAVVAMSTDADGVALYFNQGPSLPDPHKILMGNGRQTRFIRLESARVLLRPEVESLMIAAAKKAKIKLRRSGRGELIIKSHSSKQRARKRRRTGKDVPK